MSGLASGAGAISRQVLGRGGGGGGLGAFGRMAEFARGTANPNAFDVLSKGLPQGAQDNEFLQFLLEALKNTKVQAGGVRFDGGGGAQAGDQRLQQLLASLTQQQSPQAGSLPVATPGGPQAGATRIGAPQQAPQSPIATLFGRRGMVPSR